MVFWKNKTNILATALLTTAVIMFFAAFFVFANSLQALGLSSPSYNMSVTNLDALGGESTSGNYGSPGLLDYFVTGKFTGPNYIVKAGYMYFKPPNWPQIGSPESLSSSAIRWNFTDQAEDEEGFLLENEDQIVTLVRAEANISSLTEMGLEENQWYTRRVLAFNFFGNSVPSDYVSECTLVDPRVLTGSPGTTFMDLTLASFPRDSNGLSGYSFRRIQATDSSGWQSGNNFWRNSGLNINTRYTWGGQVRGICGDISGETFFSACTLANTPGQPNVSYVENNGRYTATVSFSANGNPPGTEYAVAVNGAYLQLDGTVAAAPAWSTSLSWLHRDLIVGQNYAYRVVARNCDNVLTDFSLPAALTIPGGPTKTEPTGLLETIPKIIEDFFKRLFEILENFRTNPITQILNQLGVVPALATLALVNLLSAAGLANLGTLLAYLWQLFTEPLLLLAGRRRRCWGVIYNATTKIPVDLALVRLLDAATGRLVSTRVTDRQGRFAFMAKPGKFKITVTKPEFNFPSKKVAGQTHDSGFDDLYFGEEFEIANEETIINVSIPIDPIVAVQTAPTNLATIKTYLRRRLSTVLAFVGPIMAVVCVWITPNFLTITFLIIHIIVLAFFARVVWGKRGAPWGTVYDARTGKPIGLAVVRIYSKRYGDLLETQVTDRKGRFGFLVGPQIYRLTSEKPSYIFPSKIEIGLGKYRGEDFSVKRADLVKFDIPLDPGDKTPPVVSPPPPPRQPGQEDVKLVESKKKVDIGELGGDIS